MDSCGVLIVGGGPAGSSCAWQLRRAGVDAIVLDKEKFPRDKICGGWITPAVLIALEIDPAEYAREHLLQPITGFRVGRIGGRVVEIGYDAPVSYGIRRYEFDDYLLRRSGARLASGVPLADLQYSAGRWIANGRIEARVLVGAGGHFCPVARFTGSKASSESVVAAQEVEFEMDDRQAAACRAAGEVPELYFCSDMKGYGWCFRKGNFLNVGLGRADTHRLGDHARGFVGFLKERGIVPFDLPPLHGHAYLLRGYSPRRVAGEAMLLAGDAAGLACPQSGEGIRPAIESGLLAARAIAASKGLYEQRQFEAYRANLEGTKRPLVAAVNQLLPAQALAFLARQLLQARWFVRSVVLNDWFLHAEAASAIHS